VQPLQFHDSLGLIARPGFDAPVLKIT